ncbi:MAG: class I SAM-dependent methyltransferase [Dehalococcoidia bacterium]
MGRKNNFVTRALEILRTEGIVEFSRKALAYVWREFLGVPYAFLEIKKFNSNILGELVDDVFHSYAGAIRPMQVRDEVVGLLRVLSKARPKVIIEIGTANGGTLFLFCRVAAKDATIISIDLPYGKFGGGYSWWRIPLYKTFRLPKQKLHLIRGDSHSWEILARVKNILGGKEVDFVFIDGDHSYEGVKTDFEMFSRLVRRGGIIALHDIVIKPAVTGCEVSRFWDEIKQPKYEYSEIISDWNQGWSGIGLLQWQK